MQSQFDFKELQRIDSDSGEILKYDIAVLQLYATKKRINTYFIKRQKLIDNLKLVYDKNRLESLLQISSFDY